MSKLKKQGQLFSGIGLGCLIVGIPFFFYNSKNFSDFLSVFGMVVNIILAILLVTVIQNKLSNQRALKDYFVGEIFRKSQEYESFISSIKKGELNSLEIQTKFKEFNTFFTRLEGFVRSEMNISIDRIGGNIVNVREVITSSTSFNDQYKNDTIILELSDISSFQESVNYFSYECQSAIVKINNF